MLKFQTPLPQNAARFRDKAFKEVIKLQRGLSGWSESSLTGVHEEREIRTHRHKDASTEREEQVKTYQEGGIL